MKLSTASRYGLRAILNLAKKDCCRSIKEIAKEEDISFEYLEKIFSKLKKAKIVDAKRGSSGGYVLSNSPDKISIGQILSVLEKTPSLPKCTAYKENTKNICSENCHCSTQKVWKQIQDNLFSNLNSISLASLINTDKNPIYLDYAASTPLDPEVLKAMLPYFGFEYCGNTMSLHSFGTKASEAVETSRQTFATILNTSPEEIIFTSSATESNNFVLKGIAFANSNKGKHIIISSIEHDCVLESATWLKKQGFEITTLPVDKFGLINPNDLKKNIRKDTILVSIIHGNNEIGTIQDIATLGKICKENNVYFHTDAAQSFGKTPIDVQKMNIDLLTASSHKIYGPKGIALLYVKKGTKIEPLLHGGGQEFGLRSSTVNTPSIVGFAKAAQICQKEMVSENTRLTQLRDYLIKNILKNIKGSSLNGHPTKRLSNNINISFAKVEGESLLLELDFNNIACSTGSACSSNSLEPSHVLLAIGLKPENIHGSLRFSLGRWTTKKEIDYLLEALPKVINKFRNLSPFKL